MPETVNFSSPDRASQSDNFFKSTLLPAVAVLVLILLGAGTGWYLSTGKSISPTNIVGNDETVAPGAEVSSGGNEAGIDDTATFRDRAEGTLEDGGVEGDGTHHLIRPGGASQTVALTSSIIDLDQFIGKKVEIWGETNKGQKAAWLMDVGKVKVLE